MDDAEVVSRFECFGNLYRNRQRFIDRDGTARETLRQVLAFDKFEHERGDAVSFFDPVDVRDVRMIE